MPTILIFRIRSSSFTYVSSLYPLYSWYMNVHNSHPSIHPSIHLSIQVAESIWTSGWHLNKPPWNFYIDFMSSHVSGLFYSCCYCSSSRPWSPFLHPTMPPFVLLVNFSSRYKTFFRPHLSFFPLVAFIPSFYSLLPHGLCSPIAPCTLYSI